MPQQNPFLPEGPPPNFYEGAMWPAMPEEISERLYRGEYWGQARGNQLGTQGPNLRPTMWGAPGRWYASDPELALQAALPGLGRAERQQLAAGQGGPHLGPMVFAVDPNQFPEGSVLTRPAIDTGAQAEYLIPSARAARTPLFMGNILPLLNDPAVLQWVQQNVAQQQGPHQPVLDFLSALSGMMTGQVSPNNPFAPR